MSIEDDIDSCAQALLELLAECGERGVVAYTMRGTFPVHARHRQEMRPLLQRALSRLDDEPRGTIH